jgi:hypothetical protein
MAIIKYLAEYNAPQEVLLNLFPDQFIGEGLDIDSNRRITDKAGNVIPMPRQHVDGITKRSGNWWKINMDYFYTVGLAQYNYQRVRIVRNYELLKGKLRPEDFYAEGPVMSFVDELIKDADLPAYVQHYPILNPPINTMVGEKSKRPDVARPKAVDAMSQSEEGEFYTNLYKQYVMDSARAKITETLQKQGVDTSNLEEFNNQVEQLTAEKVKQSMMDYTSAAEVWASNMLQALKREFNMKEHFEQGFRDLLISNREFFHNYEDRSRLGFKAEKVNPKNVWWLTTPDKKYIRDAYAAGLIEIMELSEIIDKYTLTEEEIDHLRNYAMQAFFPYSRVTNLDAGKTGAESVQYNAYDPLVLQERQQLEAWMTSDNNQNVNGLLGNAAPSVGTFGNRFIVTTAYWKSKRKIGLLTYIDIDGNEQSDMVSDDYKDGSHPQEISIEWKWENQWYKGVKIGNDIYYVEPLEILDYCPIIGVIHEIENTVSTSLIDLMKPFQTLYNICMNQLYRLLEKEKGKVLLMSRRHVPLQKGGTYEDSMEIWERQAEEQGVIWVDDSPDNLKKPSSFNQYTVIDWTLSQQMQTRYELAMQLKNECWELIGLNRQRLGSVTASETATGTNTAVSQSYAQTEPYFVQQEYVENQELQCILDIAQYIESRKPESTLSFIDDQGGNAFVKLQTELQLKNRDIKLFMTSRSDDMRVFQQIQGLAQAAMQNGASLYEVAQMYTETSTRKLLDVYKKLQEKNDQLIQQKQQMEQQAQEMQQQQMEKQAAMEEQHHQDDIQIKTYEIDTRANTELTVAQIKERMKIAEGNQAGNEPDYIDIMAHYQKEQDSIYKRDIEEMKVQMMKKKLAQGDTMVNNDLQHKQAKLALESERNDIDKEKVKIMKKKLSSNPKR